jgi:tyrosine-protein kinase Etk/Wzc
MQILRKKMLSTTSNLHPSIESVDVQIAALRLDLLAAASSQKNELRVSLEAINHSKSKFNSQISRIPSLEKTFLEFTRQQQIKQELYLFLLKKRVEVAISRSSNTANGRVIDPPKSDTDPTTPNRQLVLLMSGLISFAIPLALVHLKDILNDKINSRAEILDACEIPVLAEICLQKGYHTKNFNPERRSLAAEEFRSLRTNIQFLYKSQSCQTILVTSSMGGEGKSFIAANLSHSLAIAGKRVLLLEMDLRKPSLYQYLGLQKIGLTDLLSSGLAMPECIQRMGLGLSFDVITSGQPPPDPAELLASPEITEVFALLRAKYDFIVVDTPPVGLVTDAKAVSKYADLSLYVIREQVTFKNQLEDIRKLYVDNHFPGLHLILNGVSQRAGYQYNYGYEPGPSKTFAGIMNTLKILRKWI